METVLQVIGGFVLALVGLVVLAVTGFSLFLKYQIHRIKRLASRMGAPIAPVRLNLEEVPGGEESLTWRDPRRIRDHRAALSAAGFQPAGTYKAKALQDTQLTGWAKPDERFYATSGEHQMLGTYVEVVQLGDDGTVLTVTSARDARGKGPRAPFNRSTYLTGATAEEVIARARAERLPNALPTAVESFQRAFEDAYEREVKWQYTQGSLKGVDVGQLEKWTGMSADPETLAFLEDLRESNPTLTRERALEVFLKTAPYTAAEWEAMRDDVLVIYEGADMSEALARVDATYEGTEDVSAAVELGPKPTLENWSWLLTRLELNDRFEKLGETRVEMGEEAPPVEVHYYRAPAEA